MDTKRSPLLKWWQKLPPSSRASIIITSLLLVIAIPLSIRSTMTESQLAPRAAMETPGPDGNRKNILFGQTAEVIQCTLNTPCRADFTGSSPSQDADLSMTLDFLPEFLEATNCLPLKEGDINQITCGFKGTPTQTGRYKIQVSLLDSQGKTKSSIYTLQIR